MGKSKDLATGETRFVNTAGDSMTGALTGTSAGFTGDVNIGNNDSSNPLSKLRLGGTQYGASDIRPTDEGGHKVGMAFYTDGTGDTTIDPVLRMTIDSSGRVTMPNQPAFDVAQPAQVSGDHTFNQIHLNRGYHYDNSNGRFTAPVAGVYIFFWGGIKGGNSTTTARLYVKKNGSRLYSQRHLRLDGSTNQYGENGSLQWIANLAVNDYIQAETGDGNSYTSTGEYNVFSGYLIG